MKKNKQTPFWKISGKKIKGESYLLGTMHLKPQDKSVKWQTPYLKYIDLCEVFASEFPLNEVDPKLLSKYSLLPDNKRLSDYLSEKKIKRLEKVLLKSLGLPFRSLQRMQPLMILNLISERILANFQPISMDKELWEAAENKEKQLTGIETFEEQLQILQKIPIEYQLKNLQSVTNNLGQYKKQLINLGKVYDTGDIQKLHKLSKKGIGAIRKLMITERNHLMANRIFARSTKNTIFCAIGAGHLAGKEGVLRLLKQKGLSVKPIKIKY